MTRLNVVFVVLVLAVSATVRVAAALLTHASFEDHAEQRPGASGGPVLHRGEHVAVLPLAGGDATQAYLGAAREGRDVGHEGRVVLRPDDDGRVRLPVGRAVHEVQDALGGRQHGALQRHAEQRLGVVERTPGPRVDALGGEHVALVVGAAQLVLDARVPPTRVDSAEPTTVSVTTSRPMTPAISRQGKLPPATVGPC